MKPRALVLACVLAACGGAKPDSTTTAGGAAGSATAPVEKRLVNVDAEGVALGGFDPIAYAQLGKPVAGLPEHAAEYGGATYRFSSSDHKDAFDGAAHAPQYGGYCAYAASLGRLSPADPSVFEILDGQLLVFTNEDYRAQFDQDPPGNKAKADANWPGLVAKHGT